MCLPLTTSLLQHPLHPNQHGFTKGRSTESAVSNTVNMAESWVLPNKMCLASFLDISSAFGSISVDHIRDRLLHHGAEQGPTGWYHNYLKERHLEISLQGTTVEYHTGMGFPQGGVAPAPPL